MYIYIIYFGPQETCFQNEYHFAFGELFLYLNMARVVQISLQSFKIALSTEICGEDDHIYEHLTICLMWGSLQQTPGSKFSVLSPY